MKLQGIMPAMITPFTEKRDIDFGALKKVLEKQLAGGTHGFAVLGTAGEYYAMKHLERAEILRFVRKVVDERVPLIADTNALTVKQITDYSTEKPWGWYLEG